MNRVRIIARALSLAVPVAGLAALTQAPAAEALAGNCAGMGNPLYQRSNPGSGTDLLTPWLSESNGAPVFGFTTDQGKPVAVSTTARTGLVPVRRTYNPTSHDFAWYRAGTAELAAALGGGYRDQGTNFFASAVAIPGCTSPVEVLTKGGMHRFALSSDRPRLLATGWASAGVAFHAAVTSPTGAVPPPAAAVPPPVAPRPPAAQPNASTFSFVVIPDSQNEVGTSDPRMPKRIDWIVKNKAARNIAFAIHTGDVQSWDTPDHVQYANMSSWMTSLAANGIPLVASVGNHDTGAVCPGGSACPGANAHTGLRQTSTWNSYYPVSYFGYSGVYEAGKSDNSFSTFTAGGRSWLVLNIELWPRAGAVAWAKNVIASHPHENVIVSTHAFLEGDGQLSTNQGGYGDTKPSDLWAAIDDYPNVVMVFSGHVGNSAYRTLTATDGHPVVAMLTALHDGRLNPVRVVTVDPGAGTVTTEVRASFDTSKPAGAGDVDYVYPYSTTMSGLRFVN